LKLDAPHVYVDSQLSLCPGVHKKYSTIPLGRRQLVLVAFTVLPELVKVKNPFASACSLTMFVRVVNANVLAAPAVVDPASDWNGAGAGLPGLAVPNCPWISPTHNVMMVPPA
jgi:hypothetical protein